MTCGIATAIKDCSYSVLYINIRGGSVVYEQSYLFGGLVVSCKNWRCAALVYVASRVLGPHSNNSLGPLNPAIVVSMDDTVANTALLKSAGVFLLLGWMVNSLPDGYDVIPPTFTCPQPSPIPRTHEIGSIGQQKGIDINAMEDRVHGMRPHTTVSIKHGSAYS